MNGVDLIVRRAFLPLLMLCWLLLMAAPVSSAQAGLTPLHPVAVADAAPGAATGHGSECHPFLHASETVTMAVESQAERDPPQPSPAIAGWCHAALPPGHVIDFLPASGPVRAFPPLYALTGRLRL